MCLNIIYILSDAYWMSVRASAKSALVGEVSGAVRISFVLIADGVSEEHRRVPKPVLESSRDEFRRVRAFGLKRPLQSMRRQLMPKVLGFRGSS